MSNFPDAHLPITEDDLQLLRNKVASKYYLNRYGKVLFKSGYFDDYNKLQLVVVDFEKNSIPFYLFKEIDSGVSNWHHGIPGNIRPFNLYNIRNKPKDCNKIIIVNTEKETRNNIPGWHIVSWLGSKETSISLTNWKKLLNIEYVIIWTDEKSAKKIKNRLHHGKIIKNISFIDCKDYEYVLEKIIELKKLGIPDPDPYEFSKLFIHEFYGDECFEQRKKTYWIYLEDDHHWKQEDINDIKANFQTWFTIERNDKSAALIDYIRSEGLVPNKFIKDTIEFIGRTANTEIRKNPFKDSAISPYIHLKNGLIHLSKTGKIAEWIERTKQNEDFFRKKYPVHCCDYEFKKEYLNNIDINKAPTFKFIIDCFVPDKIKKIKKEVEKTHEFFTQIIAYSISPIKPTEYFFSLYGHEGTGKTFFLDLIKDIIGEDFFLERSTDDIAKNNRFGSSDFWGSKVYVEPDMKTNALLPESFIKTYAGQKQITIEKKHGQPEKGVNISIAMFFISNFDFMTKGMEGLKRRVIYIPFKNHIINPDRTLRDKIKGKEIKGIEAGKYKGKQFDERPIILAAAIQGFKKFLRNGCKFTLPEWIIEAKEEWINKSDSILGFINEKYIDDQMYCKLPRAQLYDRYTDWCKEEGNKNPYGKKRFYEEVNRLDQVKYIKSGNERYFEFFPEKRPQNDEIDIENPF